MDLGEFVKSTVLEIARGIDDAAAELAALNGLICPKFRSENVSRTGYPITFIKFELTVEASSRQSAEGTIKGGILVASANANGSIESGDSRLQRITFDLPVVLPSAGNPDMGIPAELSEQPAIEVKGRTW
jgi:hypothetical protein